MSTEDQTRALRESIISSIIIYSSQMKRVETKKNDPDARSQVGSMLDGLVEEIDLDETSWTYAKDRMLYDVYLQMRKEEGTLTDLDSVRPGLNIAQFSDRIQYHEHMNRVAIYNKSHINDGKVCSICNVRKDKSKFKKKGGSVCNACRCKSWRERKKERPDEIIENDEAD